MRRSVSVASAVAVVAVIGLSSVWAHQVIAGRAAASSYRLEQSVLTADLHSARRMGLSAAELKPVLSKDRAVRDDVPPPSGTFWNGGNAAFYDHRKRALKNLDLELHRLVRIATLKSQRRAHADAAALRRLLDTARYDGLHLQAAQHQLSMAATRLIVDRTPGGYRSTSASLRPIIAAARAEVGARQHMLWKLQQEVETARDPLTSLRRLGLARIASAQAQLAMLRLFVRHPDFGTPLAASERREIKASTLHEAAVVTAGIEWLGARVAARYGQVAPAKWVLVSTERQWAWMYQGTTQVYSTPVTTGGPQLPTSHGFFHIYLKLSPFTFHSPWPPTSQYWYPDSPVQYWMPFDGGEGLHDAPWRTDFGPGSNFLPTPGTQVDGSHGCVNMPLAAATFAWNWAPVGTPVIVV